MRVYFYVKRNDRADFTLSNGLIVAKVLCGSLLQAEKVIADIAKVDHAGVGNGEYGIDTPEE